MDQDQGLVSLEVKGDLKLMIANPALARVAVKLASTDNTGFQFRVRGAAEAETVAARGNNA